MIDRILNKYYNNEKGAGYRGYDLRGIKTILRVLGDPQNDYLSFHIAGTNGKGSTAHFLEKILRQSGYKTGLYTSPHLEKINERIKISGIDIGDIFLEKYLTQIDNLCDKENISLTYFDILTAAALLCFRDQGIDAAVIETGLGGRLDSTNVILPACVILTDISLDHEDILGPGLVNITAEKCGIIKRDIPVVTSNTTDEIITLITHEAGLKDAPLYALGKDFFTEKIETGIEGTAYSISFPGHAENKIKIKIKQPVAEQIKNSALAAAAALLSKRLFAKITDDSIQGGLNSTVIKGRFEITTSPRMVIFDPAHNPASLESLINCLNAMLNNDMKKIFVISFMKDKNVNALTHILRKLAFSIIYYITDDPRCYQPAADNQFDAVLRNADELYSMLDRIPPKKSVIIFTGSFRIFSLYRNYIDRGNEVL